MNFRCALSLLLLLLVSPALAHDDKKATETFNSVSRRVAGGDIDAVNDLKALDYDDAIPALLVFFRQNYNAFRITPQNRANALKIAKIVGGIPKAEEYFTELLRKHPGGQVPGWLDQQRRDALNCMAMMRQKMATRVVAEALYDPEVDVPQMLLGQSLAGMTMGEAPYTSKNSGIAGSPEAIAKWKAWWDTHKTLYAGD